MGVERRTADVTEMSLYDVVPDGPNGSHRRSKRAAEKRRQRRKRRTWVTVLVTVAVLAGAGAGAWFGLIKPLMTSINTPDDYPGPGTGSVTVQIPPGASGVTIAGVLQQKGVVKTTKAYLEAAADTPGSSTIQPGTYALKMQMTGRGAVQALLDPASRLVKKLTIPEGSRLADVLAKISSETTIKRADLDAAVKDTADLGLPAEAKGKLEGYIFPATYEIEPGTAAADLLRDMVTKTTDQLAELGVGEKDYQRVLTMASLVQAEGRHPQDMGKIARVLVNRMSKHERLRLDTTVHYATGKFTVFTSIKDTQFPSPYNTYLHEGLPPGPIGSPGVDALKATIKPAPGPWMYFVATNPDTGETKFATDEAGFAKLKAEYERWQKANPGK